MDDEQKNNITELVDFVVWFFYQVKRAALYYGSLWPLLVLVLPYLVSLAVDDVSADDVLMFLVDISPQVYFTCLTVVVLVVLLRVKKFSRILMAVFTALASYNGTYQKDKKAPNTTTEQFDAIEEIKRWYAPIITFAVAASLAWVTLNASLDNFVKDSSFEHLKQTVSTLEKRIRKIEGNSPEVQMTDGEG
ncbi:hypothetical protein [Idiomarina abyssalis]|uniref:Uncharacterized protein n=1 Tax=Idiomarina abyssalis TaxID=86102 RepID=A0A8I1GF29_9GAMM|nr:hypothetical protein [Idiomarina abyssalis]MBJ7265468.1 hypothetical protein [Idiomarina abyssalis]MBJ7316858.1 hypothetical protein [Idiomarina abyssalis]